MIQARFLLFALLCERKIMYTFTTEKLPHENGHNINIITIEGGEYVKTVWTCHNNQLDVIQIGEALVKSLNKNKIVTDLWKQKVKLLNHNDLLAEIVLSSWTEGHDEEDIIAHKICTEEMRNRLRYYSNWLGLKDPYPEY